MQFPRFTMEDFIAGLPRPPSREERRAARAAQMGPVEIVRTMTLMQLAYLFVGMVSWTCDAIDFFSVSLVLTRLATYFDREPHSVTVAITLTLLFRSIGALLFGALGDRYGRRWPLAANLVLVAVLELATGFVKNYGAFLAVRSLFGIGMGGIWGLSAATALENAPVGSRGLLSGLMQEGYALGFIVASVINLTAVPHYNSWRVIFYIAAGISLFMAFCRALLPESEVFLRAREEAKKHPDPEGRSATKLYFLALRDALQLHWVSFVYCVVVMSCFNFLSHGSQDVYPTFAQITKGQSIHDATVLTIIGNCGAIAGGTIAGALSQFLGRRLTIIFFCIWAAAFIPLWTLPTSFSGLAAGAFMIQVGVQGAWGVVPIWLSEISPSAFRAVFAGTTYQLGNAVSAASSQIETTSGDAHQIIVNGKPASDYTQVQQILIGVVSGTLALLMLVGPEKRARHFEQERTAIEPGAGDDHAVGLYGAESQRVGARMNGDDRIAHDDDDVEAGALEKSSVGEPPAGLKTTSVYEDEQVFKGA